MSHSVTITRTTTTSSTSAVIMNTGYLKTVPGLLKLAQLVLGAVCVGLVSYYMSKSFTSYSSASSAELFFLLMTVSFLIGTFCLLMSCLCSLSTGGIISKTMYELVFHSVAFVLYLAASVCFLIAVTDHKYSSRIYDPYMAAAVIGLVVSFLYLASAVLAQRSYRGI